MKLLGLAIGASIMIALAASRRCKVWIAIVIGTALIGILTGMNPLSVIVTALSGATSRDSLELLVMALAAVFLGRLMTELGLLGQLRQNMDKTLGNPLAPIAVIPALIGCLPVAGGAIMSAPIVRTLTAEQDIPAPRGAAINLVFRHSVMQFLPFSPALALAARLIDMPLFTLVGFMFPLGLITIISGTIAYLRPHATRASAPVTRDRRGIWPIIKYSSPIWIALLVAILYRGPVFIPLFVGTGVAIILGRQYRGLGRLFLRSLDADILLPIPTAVALRAVLVQSGVLDSATAALSASGIPLALAAVVLSIVVAGTSGNLMTHIVVAFPVIVAMAPVDVRPAYAFLAYYTGFLSYYISPLHLCQIVTLKYFATIPRDLYRQYARVGPPIILAAAAMFLLLLYLRPAVYH